MAWLEENEEVLYDEYEHFENTVQNLFQYSTPQFVVNEALNMFRPIYIKEYGKLEENEDTKKAKDVLRTIAKRKLITKRQMYFLCCFIARNHAEYQEY